MRIQIEHFSGVSGSTGNTTATLFLNSIAGYTVNKIKKEFVKGEGKKVTKWFSLSDYAVFLGLFIICSKSKRKMWL